MLTEILPFGVITNIYSNITSHSDIDWSNPVEDIDR